MPPRPAPEEEVRAAIISGLITVVAGRGYAAVTINDIVKEARVSKSTFYAQFSGKEDCYLAGYEISSNMILDLIIEAAGRDLSNEERIVAATLAYFERVSVDRATARTFILEVLAAGPVALALRHSINHRFAEVLRELVAQDEDPTVHPLSEAAAMLIVGGANELVLWAIVEDRLDELPSFAPVVAQALLAAVTGPPPDRVITATG